MATKPTPGGSDGTYGTELNEFLDVSLASDGKIADGAVFSTSAAPSVDAGVANKKYIDDLIATLVLPSISSGANDSNREFAIGDLEIKFGKFTISATSGSETFSGLGLSAFTNNCFQVFVTEGGTSTGGGGSRSSVITKNGFSWDTENASPQSPLRFFAIGW